MNGGSCFRALCRGGNFTQQLLTAPNNEMGRTRRLCCGLLAGSNSSQLLRTLSERWARRLASKQSWLRKSKTEAAPSAKISSNSPSPLQCGMACWALAQRNTSLCRPRRRSCFLECLLRGICRHLKRADLCAHIATHTGTDKRARSTLTRSEASALGYTNEVDRGHCVLVNRAIWARRQHSRENQPGIISPRARAALCSLFVTKRLRPHILLSLTAASYWCSQEAPGPCCNRYTRALLVTQEQLCHVQQRSSDAPGTSAQRASRLAGCLAARATVPSPRASTRSARREGNSQTLLPSAVH